jgi:hypothetical protein
MGGGSSCRPSATKRPRVGIFILALVGAGGACPISLRPLMAKSGRTRADISVVVGASRERPLALHMWRRETDTVPKNQMS